MFGNGKDWYTIREFHTPRFDVIVDATYDDDADASFMEPEELEEFQAKGGAFYLVRCRVMLDGDEIGTDCLGSCGYYDINEFQDHRQCGAETRRLRAEGSTAICGSYFSDMIAKAIREARKSIKKTQSVYVR